MSRGLVAAIWGAYRDPRGAVAALLAGGADEARALMHLFLACGLGFVASMPNAVRAAQGVEAPDALAGVISAHLFGYIFIAPLLLYGVAALAHLAARVFGGRAGFAGARVAFFWAALLGGPIALGLALAAVVVEVAVGAGLLPWLAYPGYAGLVFWLWLVAASLAEAEGFRATHRVAAVLTLAFVGVAAGVAALPGGVSAIG